MRRRTSRAVKCADGRWIEASKDPAIVFALGQDHRPREAGLGAFEDQHLEQAPIVMARDAPLLVVVADVERVAPRRTASRASIIVGPSARASRRRPPRLRSDVVPLPLPFKFFSRWASRAWPARAFVDSSQPKRASPNILLRLFRRVGPRRRLEVGTEEQHPGRTSPQFFQGPRRAGLGPRADEQ